VSPFPGTTRDVLELHLDLGGYPVTVLDTAGIRKTDDPVEREGVRRATEQAGAASLVLWVVDAAAEGKACTEPAPLTPGTKLWRIVNKIDLLPHGQRALPQEDSIRNQTQLRHARACPAHPRLDAEEEGVDGRDTGSRRASAAGSRPGHDEGEEVRLVSSTTGEGIDSLLGAIGRFCEEFFSPEPALVTRARQRAHLEETAAALRGVQDAAAEGREEIVAEQLRLASRSLGKLLGRVDVEDVLDVIFRDFCIGK
jgi:tRNA modification GTPase